MSIILDLPGNLERELEQAAARAGLTVTAYAVQVLAQGVDAPAAARPRTGAEILAAWEDERLLGGSPDIADPVSYARTIRERNQNRLRG